MYIVVFLIHFFYLFTGHVIYVSFLYGCMFSGFSSHWISLWVHFQSTFCVCVCVCVSVSVSLCLCVEHLKRCKISAWFSPSFFATLAEGGGGTDETGTKKDIHQLPMISVGMLIYLPAILASVFRNCCNIQFSVNGNWLSPEPACQVSLSFQHLTFFCLHV